MNLDLGKFKKIVDEPHSAILQHPDGHQIKIAKHILSDKMKGELDKLPIHQFAEGGEEKLASMPDDVPPAGYDGSPQANPNVPIPEETAQTLPTASAPSDAPPADAAADYRNAMGDFDTNKYILMNPDKAPIAGQISALKAINSAGDFEKNRDQIQQENKRAEIQDYNTQASKLGLPPKDVPQSASPVSDQTPSTTIQGPDTPITAQGPQDLYGTQAYMDAYMRGLNEQRGGLQKGAAAEGALGQAQASILDQANKVQQQRMQDYQNHYNSLDQERQAFQQDLQNSHIDPQHYLNSQGTGQRVATAIGLILGGLGGMGHGNMALDFLNNQINRDIGAQQAELGKKENLLSANMRQFGNLKDATDMTRVMQMDIVKNQLTKAASLSADPLAKARAQQAIGALDMQAAPLLSQIASRRALSQAQASQGGVDPATQVQLLGRAGILPQGQMEAANKEVAVLTAKQRAIQAGNNYYDQAEKLQTFKSRIGSPLQSPAKLDVLHAGLVPMILDTAPSKRLVPESVKQEINPYAVDFTNSPETIRYKHSQYNQYVNRQTDDTPILRGLHVVGTPQRKIQESPIGNR